MNAFAPVSRKAVVARAPDLLMVEVDGETVLMSVAEGGYHGLAATAHDIRVRLAGKMTAGGQVCDRGRIPAPIHGWRGRVTGRSTERTSSGAH